MSIWSICLAICLRLSEMHIYKMITEELVGCDICVAELLVLQGSGTTYSSVPRRSELPLMDDEEGVKLD